MAAAATRLGYCGFERPPTVCAGELTDPGAVNSNTKLLRRTRRGVDWMASPAQQQRKGLMKTASSSETA
jgi:hypothetical protein